MPSNDSRPPTHGPARQKLLADLAHAYYVDGRSKVAIAQQASLSRFQVAALLQEAQDSGIVRIEIKVPVDDRDARLAQTLGITRVVTAGSSQWAEDRSSLAAAAARELIATIKPSDVLGIAWSRTLQLVVKELPALPGHDVIQLSGALSTGESANAPRLLAELQCRSAWPLWAPLVVENAPALMRSREIALTLERADTLDVALIAIGHWSPAMSSVWDRVPVEMAEQAARDGAVAEISGHLLSSDGAVLETPVESMIVAASLAQMRRARTVLAVAYQAQRAPAVRAAAKAGLIDVLVCDESLRDALLEMTEHPGAITAAGTTKRERSE